MRTHVLRTATAEQEAFDGPSHTASERVTRIDALLLSRLDYDSTLLAGLQQQQIDKLQSVQNAAARPVLADRRGHHITPPLQRLHWLRVAQRAAFPLAMITVFMAEMKLGHGSPGQRFWPGRFGSRVSVSDPVFDLVLSFNMFLALFLQSFTISA